MDYLLLVINMVENMNGYQYFHRSLTLIAHDFSIDELKNIFNATFSQFLEDDKEYNQKTICRIFEDKYNWVIDKLIEYIHEYIRLWIVFSTGINIKEKYLCVK